MGCGFAVFELGRVRKLEGCEEKLACLILCGLVQCFQSVKLQLFLMWTGARNGRPPLSLGCTTPAGNNSVNNSLCHDMAVMASLTALNYLLSHEKVMRNTNVYNDSEPWCSSENGGLGEAWQVL